MRPLEDYTKEKIIVLLKDKNGVKKFNKLRKKSDKIFIDLSGADFSATDLSGVNFTFAILKGANFTNTCLSHAHLPFAQCQRAVFKNTDLTFANLMSVDFTGAEVEGVDWKHSNFWSIKGLKPSALTALLGEFLNSIEFLQR